MRYLNISQGRYGSYSHYGLNAYDLSGADSGIDYFTTFNPLIVVGVLKYETSGFANTVMFYDTENDITIAMSHIRRNHSHMEIAKGRQTGKIKDAHGNWCLKDLINIEDYFYIDDEYTKVLDKNGYLFEGKPMQIYVNKFRNIKPSVVGYKYGSAKQLMLPKAFTDANLENNYDCVLKINGGLFFTEGSKVAEGKLEV